MYNIIDCLSTVVATVVLSEVATSLTSHHHTTEKVWSVVAQPP